MLLASFLLQGCTQNAYTGQSQASKTSIGAGIGAATGALAGVLLGDNPKERRTNALIGAGIGAVGGGGIGYYMDRQETALRDRLRNSGVSVTRNGDIITLNMPGNITFDTNQSSLKPQFFDTLNSVVLVLKEFNKTNIRIEGHTDNVGSEEHNNQLSRERANAVSQYFASQGVDYGRLNAIGYGETRPIASNDNESGRAANRRVEIQLTPMQ
jgi:outer membrane protein OmpA-like peptidoglycan-associated protein